jgi:hypothetical protein
VANCSARIGHTALRSLVGRNCEMKYCFRALVADDVEDRYGFPRSLFIRRRIRLRGGRGEGPPLGVDNSSNAQSSSSVLSISALALRERLISYYLSTLWLQGPGVVSIQFQRIHIVTQRHNSFRSCSYFYSFFFTEEVSTAYTSMAHRI